MNEINKLKARLREELATRLVNEVILEDRIDVLSSALHQAELAVTELCHDQDPANECWSILHQIQSALRECGTK